MSEGNTVSVAVSALSYVNSALEHYTDDTADLNAVAVLFEYSKAADEYYAAHPS